MANASLIYTLEVFMQETWKELKDFEGDYAVSNFGRVKSFKNKKEKNLIPYDNNHGYLQVTLCKNGKKKKFFVHRLVGSTFIEEIEGKNTINHKNNIKTDNRVENLEWVSRIENYNLAVKDGLIKKGTNHPNWGNHLNCCKKIKGVNSITKEEIIFNSLTSAAKHINSRISNVSAVCRGKRILHKSWSFSYYFEGQN
jgi:hypothetical protein